MWADRRRDLALPQASPRRIEGVAGHALEIIATFEPGNAKRFGLHVRASADGKTTLPVWFDCGRGELGCADKRMTSDLPSGRPVTMHVVLDRCIIEVYVKGNAVTTVTYLAPSSRALAAFAIDGACTLRALDLWQMEPMWEQSPTSSPYPGLVPLRAR